MQLSPPLFKISFTDFLRQNGAIKILYLHNFLTSSQYLVFCSFIAFPFHDNVLVSSLWNEKTYEISVSSYGLPFTSWLLSLTFLALIVHSIFFPSISSSIFFGLFLFVCYLFWNCCLWFRKSSIFHVIQINFYCPFGNRWRNQKYIQNLKRHNFYNVFTYELIFNKWIHTFCPT